MNQLAFAVALEAAYRCRPWVATTRLAALHERMTDIWADRLTRGRRNQLMRELYVSLSHIVNHRPEWVREYARQVGR